MVHKLHVIIQTALEHDAGQVRVCANKWQGEVASLSGYSIMWFCVPNENRYWQTLTANFPPCITSA